ncbi:hypothetical protein MMC08_005084 [Hypocenomyce scalaris]|nr:hypothetical protein [Hypocenomyce scalaris]
MSDAWFADKIAPDSDKDDGCHPLEAEALKNYLSGTTATANEAARAITLPVENEPNPSADVCRLWALLIDALTDLPTAQQKIIHLLQAIRSIQPASLTGGQAHRQPENQVLWRDLPGFGHLWADLHQTGGWRRLIKNCSPAQRDELRTDLQTRAAIEAQLVVAHVGNIPLGWGYECICNALEKSDAALDVEVPAAAEWLRIAGKYIYGKVADEENWALKTERDLWKGGERMSEERWRSWKERLSWVARGEQLGQGTRDAANVAIKAMEIAEQ